MVQHNEFLTLVNDLESACNWLVSLSGDSALIGSIYDGIPDWVVKSVQKALAYIKDSKDQLAVKEELIELNEDMTYWDLY